MLIQEEALPGESLVSFLIRQALANGFSGAHDYLLARIRNGELGIEWVTAFDAGKMEQWAGRLSDEGPQQNSLAKRFLQSQPRHFCPDCLDEGAYWRASWEYTFFAFCPVHRVWLEDRCGSCDSPVGFWDAAPDCLKCGSRLRFRQQRELIKDEKALTLAQILARSAEAGSWMPDLVDMETPWTLPSPLTYEQLSRVVLLLGGYAQGRAGNPQKIPFKSNVKTVRKIVTHAAHALFPWPDAFLGFLKALRDSGRQSITGKMSYFYKAIYTEFQSTEVGFLQSALEVYMKESWDGVLNRRFRNFSPELLANQRMQPAANVAKAHGLSRQELIKGIQSGAIQGVIEPLPSGRSRVSLRVDMLDEVVSQFELCSLKEAVAELGLPERRVRELLEAEILHGRPPVGGGPWAIPRTQVAALGARLLALGGGESKGPAKSLSYLARYFPAVAKEFLRFLQAVLAGDIPVGVIDDPKALPFERVRVSLAALRQWELEQVGHLSVPHAAELLGIKQEVAYHLYRRGLLAAYPDKAMGAVMTAADIRDFQNRFVLAKDLARRVGSSPRAAIAALSAKGVKPVSGPDVDGGRQVIYERETIARMEGSAAS